MNLHQRYLQLLSEKFPDPQSVITEIVNLRAILSLPKGTEHFVSDLHGAANAFIHMVKNASGVIRRKVDDVYKDNLTEEEKRALCALIYYPDERIELVLHRDEHLPSCDCKYKTIDDWYRLRLHQLVAVTRFVSAKYTRSKVRRLLPQSYAYIMEELLHEDSMEKGKVAYWNAIIDGILEVGVAKDLIIWFCYLIHSLVIDTFHIVGDIYDRGPRAEKIMDILSTIRDYDIQWGNHDIEWMGAAMGNEALIATVLRVSIRYANIETLEEGYGINLLPLANFAMQHYADDPCKEFQTKDYENNPRLTRSAQLMAKMHKAISIIQFKLEAATYLRHPEWEMSDRALLSEPLTTEERELMDQLKRSFRKSEKLQKHLAMFINHGSLFLVRNGFLLYHAAIPLNADGSFTELTLNGHKVKGRALMERIDEMVRQAYFTRDQDAIDFMLYLWQGPCSPLYNKDKMTTYERYFNADETTWKETEGAYFSLANRKDICEMILTEFGLDPETGRIINGHIPVKTLKGETPIRAEGKRFVIDGGFSKPYQLKTGIAGYTLIYSSHGIELIEHESFESREQAILSGTDIHNRTLLKDYSEHRLLVADTDNGQELRRQIHELKQLLATYI